MGRSFQIFSNYIRSNVNKLDLPILLKNNIRSGRIYIFEYAETKSETTDCLNGVLTVSDQCIN